MAKANKKIKFWKRILICLLILCIYLLTKKIEFNEKVIIAWGETASKILNQLGPIEKIRVKLYIKTHHINFSKLEAGTYTFNGKYSKAEFVEKILKGSEKDYLRLTILEGRSMYDIDDALTRKWYITGGDYIAFITNPTIIAKYQTRYDFLKDSNLSTFHLPLSTLEGFLYPDTYQVDKTKNIIDQLVYIQLETFNTRVRKKVNSSETRYRTVILASILEKEERNLENKATVAGIFLKRLEIGMALDADITLCYGLKMPYNNCTPTIIGQNISDKKNIYNTRQVRGLPPTPIGNPTRESINAVLNSKISDYLYYLHDSTGEIHYGRTLDEHNTNKAKYL